MGEGDGRTTGIDAGSLRERLPQKPETPQKAESVETAQDAVRQLNAEESKKSVNEKDRKTFGRTPDGTGKTSGVPVHISILAKASHIAITT